MNASFMISLFVPFFILLLVISPACCADLDIFSGISFLGGKYSTNSFPDEMYPGQSGQYMVEFLNTGMTAWENDVEKVGVECFGDSSIISVEQNIQLLPQGSRVHSGKSYHFPFFITAHNIGQAYLTFAVVQLHPSGKTTIISDPKTVSINVMSGIQGNEKNTGSIQVSAGPLHLPVELDGIPVGLTPLTLPDIPVGDHLITIEGKEGVVDKMVVVEPGSLSSITYSPDKSVVVIETGESLLLDNSNPLLRLILSNFFIALGLVFALTIIAVISIVIITIKMRKVKFTISEVLPCSLHKKSTRDFAIETRRKSAFDEVIFEPVAGLFNQGEQKLIKIQVTNLGIKAIVVQKIRIDPGKSWIILKEIMDDDPGDNEDIQEISYIDSNGKEKSQIVHLQYRIKPGHADISWFFKRFILKKGKIVAIVNIKNNGFLPLNVDSTAIPSGEEKEMELELDVPDNDAASVYKKLEIFAGSLNPFTLSVKIPYNMGIFLFFSKKYAKSLKWFNQQITRDNGDPTINRYRDLIVKKLNLSSKSQKPDLTSLDEELPGFVEKRDQMADVSTRVSSSPQVPGFPDSLLPVYKPSELISSDRLGLMFSAVRASDNEEVAIRVLDLGLMPPSQIELQIHTWRALKHPNILQIKFWERDPVYYIEFDLPSGAVQYKRKIFTLADLKVPIPSRAALYITRGLAKGIYYIHQQGVRHYLLEPSTIFLDKELHPKISGFDMSALILSKIPADCWIIAPEQRNPEKYGNPGKKTDIYQAGAIFNYLLSGQVPGSTEKKSILPSHFRDEYSIYDPVVQKSLHIDKNERYGDISEMIQELDSLLSSSSKKG